MGYRRVLFFSSSSAVESSTELNSISLLDSVNLRILEAFCLAIQLPVLCMHTILVSLQLQSMPQAGGRSDAPLPAARFAVLLGHCAVPSVFPLLLDVRRRANEPLRVTLLLHGQRAARILGEAGLHYRASVGF